MVRRCGSTKTQCWSRKLRAHILKHRQEAEKEVGVVPGSVSESPLLLTYFLQQDWQHILNLCKQRYWGSSVQIHDTMEGVSHSIHHNDQGFFLATGDSGWQSSDHDGIGNEVGDQCGRGNLVPPRVHKQTPIGGAVTLPICTVKIVYKCKQGHNYK